jgi:hypothetical protein
MRTAYAIAFTAALGLSAGCDKGTPGGPGTTKNSGSNTPHVGTADDTFTLSVPTLSTKIKQGEAKVVDVGIHRGKNFDQDVALKLEGLPQGVTAEPAAPAIKHGDKDAKVTLKAADTAAVGDFTVKVVGHPGKGGDATNDLKITVDKK